MNLKRVFYSLVMVSLIFTSSCKKESKVQKEGDLWNQLSDEQRKELLISESESKYKENLVNHEKQKAKHKKWL